MLPTFDGEFSHPLRNQEGKVTAPSQEWTGFYSHFETEAPGLTRAIMDARNAVITILAQGCGIVIKPGQYHIFDKQLVGQYLPERFGPLHRIADRPVVAHILIDTLHAHNIVSPQQSWLFQESQIWLIRLGTLRDITFININSPLLPADGSERRRLALEQAQIGAPDGHGKIINITQMIRPGSRHIPSVIDQIVENHLQQFGINGDQTLPGRVAHAILLEIASTNTGFSPEHIDLAYAVCSR